MGLFGLGKKQKDAQNSDLLGDEQRQILNEEKQDMIKGIEDMPNTTVKEVMIPRIDVDFISIDIPQDELLEKILASGHSRFPVYDESIDNVIGVMYVKDLIYAFARKESIDLKKIIRKAYFIPESKHIDSLLREFKRRHLHIAMAVDEYGGISGIVTMEDIIEEIVGDIQDEFDNEREDIISLSGDIWLCDARISLDDLNETIGAEFPTQEFDTLGGFVFDLFGKIPVKFEKTSWNNFDLIVQDMEGHRINVIKVIRRTGEKTADEKSE
ncbi:HlyC/CorC family transporter [Treponema parvum]|uniref:HlyC/CorC family transporter n=1 Tax=Treponema parvum TaxID=138851 RepID=A0A975ICQ6_9SPIR|nr:hemolysin family protein [Treponema parvum]QTQ12042.1 HlyC/CorC family transporter [Treponema parvum]QTQ15982.1 HlyC/CorC family transporter [Treponema parvum]